MTETPTHTPLRLNAGDETRIMEDRPDGVCLPVCDVKCGGMSGRTVKEGEVLAAFIVQAVNSHHRLVDAAEAFVAHMRADTFAHGDTPSDLFEQFDAELKEARHG